MADEVFNPETVPPADPAPATDSQAEQAPAPGWYLYDVSAAPVRVARGPRDELIGLASGYVGCWCVTPEALDG